MMKFEVGMKVNTVVGEGTIVDIHSDNYIVKVGDHTINLGEEGLNSMKIGRDDLYFAKVKPDAITPSKRDEDGAYDLYACFDEDYMVIAPHTTKLVPTGIATAFSSDYVAIVKERGSNGSKGIAQRSGVIDSGFRGEWFCPLTNTNDVPVIIAKKHAVSDIVVENAIVYPYEKGIAQFIMVEVPKMNTYEIPYEDLQKFESERGTGCLGSSKK